MDVLFLIGIVPPILINIFNIYWCYKKLKILEIISSKIDRILLNTGRILSFLVGICFLSLGMILASIQPIF